MGPQSNNRSQAGISEHETATPAAAITITTSNTTSAKDEPSDSEAMDTNDWTNENDTTHHFNDDNDESETDNDCSVVNMTKQTGFGKRNYSRSGTILSSQSQEKPQVQYTLSNTGGTVQMIVNRYIYFVKTTKKRAGIKTWRCVNYVNYKCPALILTKNDIIIKRSGIHNHEYHDKKILKKVQANLVFATLNSVSISSKQKTDK